MNVPPNTSARRVTRLESPLGNGGGRFARFRPRMVVAAVLISLAGLGYLLVRGNDNAAAPAYRSEAAAVGTLVVKVSANGTLQPTNQVDVGSELSGIVDKVFVDDNDRVSRGQVLARLDLSKLQDAVTRSRASLAAAEAHVLQAQATADEARAILARFRQVSELSGGKVPSKSEMDTAEATVKRAAANEANARASVAQARATLRHRPDFPPQPSGRVPVCIYGLPHAAGPARQDHPGRVLRADGVERRVEGQNLGIHGQLAQPARDELRELRAEVEDEQGLSATEPSR